MSDNPADKPSEADKIKFIVGKDTPLDDAFACFERMRKLAAQRESELAEAMTTLTAMGARVDELQSTRSATPAIDRNAIIEKCAKAALEQRCERGTPWDLACVTIAEEIRKMAGSDRGDE